MNQFSICARWGVLLALFLICGGCAMNAAASVDPSQYKIQKTFQIGGEGRWDFLTYDAEGNRLFVPRQTHVQIIDPDSGKVIGDIADTPGVHGVALSPFNHHGYTSNGGDSTATEFDATTLAVFGKQKTGAGPDAIIYDPASQAVLAINHKGGSVTVYPPGDFTPPVPITIDIGGTLEFAAADGIGHVYVDIEDQNKVAVIDTKAMKVTDRWSVDGGEEPAGIAVDVKNRRLFVGCHNKVMAVMDADTGKVLATAPIGGGVDACEFDPQTGLAFASCGEGVLSIIKETSPGKFETIRTVPTLPGARTMALNPKTHEIYLATAEMEPTTEPGKRPTPKAGTFKIVVVGP